MLVPTDWQAQMEQRQTHDVFHGFVPQEKVDYLAPEATLTVARLLREVIRSHDDFPAVTSCR